MRFLFYVASILASLTSIHATSRMTGDLPRVGNKPLESILGVESIYGELKTSDGARLRTILTRPDNSSGKLPVILFVQWLSCDSIELRDAATDEWSEMLRRLIRDSGMAVMRTEKSGVGDSLGVPCDQLDYNTELSYHRAALEALKHRDDIDADRIVVFGASMGATYAPLIAADQKLAGVIVWGGGARTWFERQIAFDRRALELRGVPPSELTSRMRRLIRFETQYLLEQKTPNEIAKADARLGKVWTEIVGPSADLHYGRPIAFHHQAQRQDWARAWARVNAPVLALHGEYDWFEVGESIELISRIVNSAHPGTAEFREIAQTDHHFKRYSNPEAAFREEKGTVNAAPAVEAMLHFLRNHIASR
jgi:dienelactone hydrolase